VARLQDEPGILYAYLHGSFLDQPAFRDVDVAIHVTDAAAPGGRLAVDLSAALTAAFGLPVDVRAVNDAPLSFRFHALRGRLLVSRDDERLADAIEDTARRYHDIESLLRRATREAFSP
jgi:uncharacterized protein